MIPWKLIILIFFGFRHSFRGLTSFKHKNFEQKLKISRNTNKFAQHSIWVRKLDTSPHHTMKIKDFFLFCYSFRGLTSLKDKNFDKKLKISNNTKKFAQCSSWEYLINMCLHHGLKITDFKYFLLRHSFRGLTPLKFKNFDQKLKVSNNTHNFAHNSLWVS